jgi:CspA family cold shock protein
MQSGYVKKWDYGKGWGFIEDEEGCDYFFNISNVRKGIKVKEGMRVKFDVFETNRGPEAENITIV